MLAALARIDILLLDCTDVNSINWNILPNYIHNQLDIPIEFKKVSTESMFLHHRLGRLEGNENFDCFFFA